MATATLLLNATHEPLRVLPIRRAIGLIISGKAHVLEEEPGSSWCSKYLSMPHPLVIKLNRFVRVPYRARLPLTRKNLIARDLGKCGYCRRAGSTIDHIVPRAKGGQHTWENVALACSPCNAKKGDKTLAELGWELHITPCPPHGLVWYTIGLQVEEAWMPYLATV